MLLSTETAALVEYTLEILFNSMFDVITSKFSLIGSKQNNTGLSESILLHYQSSTTGIENVSSALKQIQIYPDVKADFNFNQVCLNQTTQFKDSSQINSGQINSWKWDFGNGQINLSNQIPFFLESSRYVAIDDNQNIWVSHPYHGVYRVYKNSDKSYSSKLYDNKSGLPFTLNNHVFKVKNRVLVATEKGIYEYNPKKDIFEPEQNFKKIKLKSKASMTSPS